jgi:hypothetical protein
MPMIPTERAPGWRTDRHEDIRGAPSSWMENLNRSLTITMNEI